MAVEHFYDGVAPITGEQSRSLPQYAFTDAELQDLCRWYSALKYAFPETDAFMIVSHRSRFSMVAISGVNGRPATAGMLFKHVKRGEPMFSWHTEADTIIGPTAALAEITGRHIAAAGCPADERKWLDRAGWEAVLKDQTVYDSGAH